MKRFLIAGNWKMNNTISQSIELVKNMLALINGKIFKTKILIAPPFTSLFEVKKIISNSNIALGAQNCYFENSGAFTGEISPTMLKEIGCKYVIIGHSERRQIIGETDSVINKKIISALKSDLIPIFCIGETLQERSDGLTFNIIERQFRLGLKGLQTTEIENIVIAYEPVWAIGTGVRATKEQISQVHSFIRAFLGTNYGCRLQSPMLLYGGSVNSNNCSEIFEIENVDGALVGGASLNASEFISIVEISEKIGTN